MHTTSKTLLVVGTCAVAIAVLAAFVAPQPSQSIVSSPTQQPVVQISDKPTVASATEIAPADVLGTGVVSWPLTGSN